MIRNIYINNFRCFKTTTITLKQLTIMVGKNNAGKSTLIEALRIVSVISNRIYNLNFKPAPQWVGDNSLYGISPSIENLNISTQNIFYLYGNPPANINVIFDNNVEIHVFIGEGAEVFATLYDHNRILVLNKKMLKNILVPPINILPQISPVLSEEKIIKKRTVQANILTKLSSRNFRNQIYYYNEDFNKFKELTESTWHGLSIDNITFGGDNLSLMIRDNSFTAEIGWMGHGLQMWLQTMWFLGRSALDSTVILDEPDVYMHADLQRKLIQIIKTKYKQIIIASHSVEIMSEVEPNNILLVDKQKETQSYANKAPIVQKIIEDIGSVHNIEIVRLFSSKKFLIVEGDKDDIKMLGIFQSIMYPQTNEPFDIVPKTYVDGWGGWQRVIGSSNVLNNNSLNINTYCIFDSDYHTLTQKEERYEEAKKHGINLHIWEMKEIENYTLIPNVIYRYINNKKRNGVISLDIVNSKLDAILEGYKEELYSDYATEIQNNDRSLVLKTALIRAKEIVNSKWNVRLSIVPGKKVVKDLSSWSQEEFGVSFSPFHLAREFNIDEIPYELKCLICKIEQNETFV